MLRDYPFFTDRLQHDDRHMSRRVLGSNPERHGIHISKLWQFLYGPIGIFFLWFCLFLVKNYA